MFFKIVFEIAVAVLLIFGAVLTAPGLMNYHKKIIEKEGEAKGFNMLKDAFSKLIGLSLAMLIAISFGMLLFEATSSVSEGTTAIELINTPSKVLPLVLAGVCCSFPFLCGNHLFHKMETMNNKKQVLHIKMFAGILLIALAISYHNSYYSRYINNERTLPVETALFAFLILFTSDTYYLEKKTGVRTPWWAPLGFACLMLADIIVELIQT